jgi:hypothetical protein
MSFAIPEPNILASRTTPKSLWTGSRHLFLGLLENAQCQENQTWLKNQIGILPTKSIQTGFTNPSGKGRL